MGPGMATNLKTSVLLVAVKVLEVRVEGFPVKVLSHGLPSWLPCPLSLLISVLSTPTVCLALDLPALACTWRVVSLPSPFMLISCGCVSRLSLSIAC